MSTTLTKSILIPLVLIIGFVLTGYWVMSSSPEVVRKHNIEAPRLSVETLTLSPRSYQISLPSYGTVEPRTRGDLVSQVGGKIDFISENFRVGGFFEKNELLLKIETADYEVELQAAKASLVSAQQAMVEEQARAAVATKDWNRLGNRAKASALALRKPQLRATQANIDSANAAVSKAQLNFKRTSIRAPYAGRVLSKQVDIGQVITSNKALANIYAIDSVEIRLPIKNHDLRYVDLPRDFKKQKIAIRKPVAVTISSSLIANQQWQGKLVRTEGAIDSNSQQLHVIAKIEDPYGVQSINKQPLKIGQYVTAIIQGRKLDDVLVIPNAAIYHNSYVYVVEDNLLQRREIKLAWQNDNDAIIDKGLQSGDLLVVTSLGQVTSGTRVDVIDPSARTVPGPMVSKKSKTMPDNLPLRERSKSE